MLRLHRLVVEFIKMKVGSTDKETQITVEQVMLDTAKDLNSKGYPAPMRALQQHIRLITQVALERKDKIAADLCTQLSIHLQMIGSYAEAQYFIEQALAIQQKVLGEEHPDTAKSLNDLAGLYQAQGKYEQAEPLYQQALAIRQKVLGEEHPDTAKSLNDLAALYQAQGKYEQAEPLYQQALAIRQKVLGEEHPDTAKVSTTWQHSLPGTGEV